MNQESKNPFDVYLGVVTHPSSSYSTKHIEQFYISSLSKNSDSTHVKLNILSENAHDESEVSLLGILINSINISILAMKWQRYLGAKNRFTLWQLAFCIKTFGKLSVRLLNPTILRIEKNKALRILNITSSHLKLIREAVEQDFDGILILEDDADFQSSELLGSFLDKLLEISAALAVREHYVDLSESFSLLQLGAEHLIIPSESQKIVIQDNVYCLDKMKLPITNTVCAVFYSLEFARVLEKQLSKKLAKRFEKYIPIDWLINKILIELYNDNYRVSCYTTNPGIFRQQSIHRSTSQE